MSFEKKFNIVGTIGLLLQIPFYMIVIYVFNHMVLASFDIAPWSTKQILLPLVFIQVMTSKAKKPKSDPKEKYDDLLYAIVYQWTAVFYLVAVSALINAIF